MRCTRKTRVSDVGEMTFKLKLDWVGHVWRMHFKDEFIQPLYGRRRTASNDGAGQERDGGLTWL